MCVCVCVCVCVHAVIVVSKGLLICSLPFFECCSLVFWALLLRDVYSMVWAISLVKAVLICIAVVPYKIQHNLLVLKH